MEICERRFEVSRGGAEGYGLMSEVWYSLRAFFTQSLPNSRLFPRLVSTTFVLLVFNRASVSFRVLGPPIFICHCLDEIV